MAVLQANGIILNFGTGTERNVAFAEDRIQQLPGALFSANRNPTICDPLSGGNTAVLHGGTSNSNTFRLIDINSGAYISGGVYAWGASTTNVRIVELKNCFVAWARAINKGGNQVVTLTGLHTHDYPTPAPDGRAFVPANRTANVQELIVNEDLTHTIRTVGSLSSGGFERFYYHAQTNAMYAFGAGKTQMLKLSLGRRNDLANYPDAVSLLSGLQGRNGAAAVARLKPGSPIYAAPTAGGRFMEITFNTQGVPTFTEIGPVINESYTLLRYANNGRIYCFKGHDETSLTAELRASLQPVLEINTSTNVIRTLNNVSRVGFVGQGNDGDLVFAHYYATLDTAYNVRFKVTESGINDGNVNALHELFYGFNVPLSGN